MVRHFMILLLALIAWAVEAADALPAGIHKGLTSPEGKYRFSVIIPTDVAAGTGAPVLFVMPAFTGLRDPSPWKPWADQRGCVVVALDDGLTRVGDKDANPYEHIPEVMNYFAASVKAAEALVPLHPYARLAVSDHSSSQMGASFAKAQGERLGGLLLTRPFSFKAPYTDEIPKHLGVFVLLGEQDESMKPMFDSTRGRLRDMGLMVRSALVAGGKPMNEVPQFGCDLAADHLLDFVLVTHPRIPPKNKVENQQMVLTRGEQVEKLPDAAAQEQLGWLLSLPEFDKTLKNQVEGLANRWMDAGISLAKFKEMNDIVLVYEELSLVAKRPQAKLADAAHVKAVATELKRMRKDNRIKLEIVAADLLAETLAMLEADFTLAKQRIALKQLEDLTAKHPATHAGKEAAKLLEPLRINLR
ncbi:MAG TPA: hypothetical protein VHX44_09920 [Planctomycetota bacterium]|nr:hypothetical protein [Planctomycetota bacterium]